MESIQFTQMNRGYLKRVNKKCQDCCMDQKEKNS